MRKIYSDDAQVILAGADRKAISAAKNRMRARANNAVKSGRLPRAERCSSCGGCPPLEAHHDDYSRPLAVRWLCVSCHRTEHQSVKVTTEMAAEIVGARAATGEPLRSIAGRMGVSHETVRKIALRAGVGKTNIGERNKSGMRVVRIVVTPETYSAIAGAASAAATDGVSVRRYVEALVNDHAVAINGGLRL